MSRLGSEIPAAARALSNTTSPTERLLEQLPVVPTLFVIGMLALLLWSLRRERKSSRPSPAGDGGRAGVDGERIWHQASRLKDDLLRQHRSLTELERAMASIVDRPGGADASTVQRLTTIRNELSRLSLDSMRMHGTAEEVSKQLGRT